MIEKMKKLSLLLRSDDRNVILRPLQDLGVVHVEFGKDTQRLEVLLLKENITKLERIYSFIKALTAEEHTTFHQEATEDLDAILDVIEKTNVEIEDLKAQGEKLAKEIAAQEIWGDYDASKLAALEGSGLHCRFATALIAEYETVSKEPSFVEVTRDASHVYYVALNKKGEEVTLVGQEVFLAGSLTQLKAKALGLHEDIMKRRKTLLSYGRYLDAISQGIKSYQDRLAYALANNSLVEVADGKALLLQGWFPVKKETEVKAFLEASTCAFLIETPTHKDSPPIAMKNGKLATLFEPITKVYSLPNYHEADTTAFLGPFFALFVGLCLADVGYGFLMLIATVTAFFVVKGELKKFAGLGIVLSLTTILGGILLGDMFGIQADSSVYPSFLKSFASFGSMDQAMRLPILLGIVQVLIGHLLRSYNGFRNNGIQGALKPLGTACLVVFAAIGILQMGYFGDGPHLMVGPIPIGPWIYAIPNLPLVTQILAIVGIVLVLFFNGVEHHVKFYLRPAHGLWELFEFFSQILGDFLSYLRLFALGLAGGLLAMSFNTIGLMVLGKGDNPLLWLALVVVLLLGHSINLGLALIASFVHPVRLTFVEFYKAIGFKGGGVSYSPFRMQTKSHQN